MTVTKRKKYTGLCYLFICLCISSILGISSTASATINWGSAIYISSAGQVVDSITVNGKTVTALYAPRSSISNYDEDGTYCCAAFVKRFYSTVYGIGVNNLYPGNTPNIYSGSGYFYKTTTPKIGDIAGSSEHWAIVKSVSGNSVTLIEQNCWNKAYNSAMVGRVLTSESSYWYWRWSGNDVSDTTPPSISNVQVSDVNKDGYTVTCNVSDNVGVTNVRFPSWNEDIHGGNEANWLQGTLSGNTASVRVNLIDLKSGAIDGNYMTHIYVYDAMGNSTNVAIPLTYIDRTAPQISDVSISWLDGLRYNVRCKVTDNIGIDRVQFPTWTLNNGQDDLAKDWQNNLSVRGYSNSNDGYYYFTTNVNVDHNGEKGDYRTHIYAYDAAGNSVCYSGDVTAYINVPEINLGFDSWQEAHSRDVNMIYAKLATSKDLHFSSVRMVTTTEKDGEVLSVERDYGEQTYQGDANRIYPFFQVIDNKDLKGATENFKTTIYLTDDSGKTTEFWYEYNPAFYKETFYDEVKVGEEAEVLYEERYEWNYYYEDACKDYVTYIKEEGKLYPRVYTGNKAGRAYIVGYNPSTGAQAVLVVDVVETTELTPPSSELTPPPTESTPPPTGSTPPPTGSTPPPTGSTPPPTGSTPPPTGLTPSPIESTTPPTKVTPSSENSNATSSALTKSAITTKKDKTTKKTVVTKPAKVKWKSCKAKKWGKVVAKWKKVSGADGYQIQYARKRSFKGKKSETAYGKSTTLWLKSKKKYFIRVRAYTYDDYDKVYGSWSSVKKIKTKK